MQWILYTLAIINGFLLGGNVAGLGIFQYQLLPKGHTLIFPVLLISATLGALTAWYIEPSFLTPIVLIESVANILLFTHAINEDSRKK